MLPKDLAWQLAGVATLVVLVAAYTSQRIGLAAPFSDRPFTAALDTQWHDGCYDGDTCQFRRSDGSVIRVRLARIDSPERGQACSVAADRARARLIDLLTNSSVTVHPQHTDPYDRLVAELSVRPRSTALARINASDFMLRHDLAMPYGEPTCPTTRGITHR